MLDPPKAYVSSLQTTLVDPDTQIKEGQVDKPQLLFARAVARNGSFRLGNSFIRSIASSRETVARGGRSILICFEVFDFFMASFCTLA